MPDILHRVGIKASPEEVYKALATRDGLAGWWTTNTKGGQQDRRRHRVPLQARRESAAST